MKVVCLEENALDEGVERRSPQSCDIPRPKALFVDPPVGPRPRYCTVRLQDVRTGRSLYLWMYPRIRLFPCENPTMLNPFKFGSSVSFRRRRRRTCPWFTETIYGCREPIVPVGMQTAYEPMCLPVSAVICFMPALSSCPPCRGQIQWEV